MIVDLTTFSESTEKYFRFTGEIDESEMKFLDREISFDDTINYEAEFFVLDDGDIEMLLNIDMTYIEPCDRCLKDTENIQNIQLSGRLIEGTEENQYEEGMENLILYENNKLDLGEYIKTQILISLPMKIICDEDCKGLCSSCGINLNDNTCNCIEHTIDPRLLDLQKFFPKE